MPVDGSFWATMGAVVFITSCAAALFAVRSRRVGRHEIVWIIPAAISAAVFADIGLTVSDLRGDVTAIDLLALAAAGAGTIALLARGLAGRH